MRKGKGFRALLSFCTVAWLFLLLGLFCVVVETLGYHFGVMWAWAGESLPVFTKDIAIPIMGGLGYIHPRSGVTWLTYVVWGLLFAWPIANLVFLWVCKDPDRARWGFLYSAMGYGIYVFTVLLALAVGLSVPFMY